MDNRNEPIQLMKSMHPIQKDIEYWERYLKKIDKKSKWR